MTERRIAYVMDKTCTFKNTAYFHYPVRSDVIINIILDNTSANAELERQVDYYNVQESMEEIVDSDACDMLWESNDDETFII